MSALSRQVTTVSQELQEMSRLLKPLFHSPSIAVVPPPVAVTPPLSTVTPPPSRSSDSFSPAPPLLTPHAPVGFTKGQNSTCSIQTSNLQEFDPMSQQSTSYDPLVSYTRPVTHCSAPPSLNSSPLERNIVPKPYWSTSNPSLSSATLLLDLAVSDSQSLSWSHLQSQDKSQDTLLNLQEGEWGEHKAQLSFIDEGRPSV